MKKIISLLAALILVIIPVSCAQTQQGQVLPQTGRPFSAELDISFNDFSAEAELTFRNSASATLEITDPDSLEGLIFTLQGEELTAKYQGLDFPLEDTNGQAVSAARLIFSAIANASTSKDAKINSSANEFTVSGNVLNYDYQMNFNKTTGAIKEFSVPSQKLTVKFTDFEFLG